MNQKTYTMKKVTSIFRIVKTVVDVIGSILCTIKRKQKEENPTSDEKLAVSVAQG